MNNPFEAIDARLTIIESILLDLKERTAHQNIPATDSLLTVEDTAKFLSLSVATVYGLISKGDIPVMKRSKRCYFSKNELIEYLKEGRHRTNSELAAEAEKFIKTHQK